MKAIYLKSILLFALIALAGACATSNEEFDLDAIGEQLSLLEEQTREVMATVPVNDRGQVKLVPRTIKNGELHVVPGGDWTSGFFPGTLWYMYTLSGEEDWKDMASAYTWILEDQQYNAKNHDVGFRMFCSFGNALLLGGDLEARAILMQSAKTLISRYYEGVGAIRSWDFNGELWQCPVIIDNMMNLELLFWASEESGDPIYREIAIAHAYTTLNNHFREDFSTWHVVDYDTISGEVRNRHTHQGFGHESSWARGQAWGLYGYTMCYRFTEDLNFLAQAEHIAAFLLNHPRLPEDGIPYWDFDAPGIPDEPRDVSAGMIMASALLELSTYSEKGAQYKAAADRMLESAWKKYRSAPGDNFGFILDHSVGHMPGDSEIDVPINYADYYFMEALVRSSPFPHLNAR